MNIDINFLIITITLGHNIRKTNSYETDKQKQYMLILIKFDKTNLNSAKL